MHSVFARRLAPTAAALFLAHSAIAADSVAEIVSLEGKGEAREARQVAWSPAKVKQPLFPTNFVRTLDLSRMGVLLAEGTQVRLAPNSVLQIKSAAKGTDAKTILNLNAGRSWVQSKSAPRGLVMETPSAVAAIRGTDWEMVVDPDGRATLSVLSGEVDFSNDFGALVVQRGEQARAEKGKAPVKLQVTVSRERVQWVSSVRADPDSFEGTRGLGMAEAYARLKRYADSGAQRPAEADLLLADFEAYRGDMRAATEAIDRGRARNPKDERFAAALSRYALLEGESAKALAIAREAAKRAPDSLDAWLAVCESARLDGYADEAASACQRAIDLAAGDPRGWLGLGIVEEERNNLRPALDHLGKAVALDPANASAVAEDGTASTAAGALGRARASFSKALDLQPDNYVALTGLGILELRLGNREAATEALLKATLIEPRYARAYAYLAAAYYQDGRREAAADMLKRAAEVDPRDPLPYVLSSMVRIDAIDPVAAAAQGREALVRLPFLKSLDAVADNQKGVANVGNALGYMGLEAWASSAAQESYLPFWGGSHLFLADRYPGEYSRRSELMQGFITDSLAFGASNRFQALVPAPGNHATATLRYTRSDDISLTEPVLSVNGIVGDGAQFAYFLEGIDTHIDPRNTAFEARAKTYTVALGAKPSYDLSFFLYANRLSADVDIGKQDVTGLFSRIDGSVGRIDVGARYSISASDAVWIKAGAGREDSNLDQSTNVYLPNQTLVRASTFNTRPDSRDAGARYTGSLGKLVEITLGAEYARVESPRTLAQDSTLHFVGTPSLQQYLDQNDIDRSEAVNVLATMGRGSLVGELGFVWRDYRKDRDISVTSAQGTTSFTDDYHKRGTDPRAGVVWRPREGNIGRLACLKWLRPAALDTLQPVAVAGIPVETQLVFPGGDLQQCRAQWEWTISPVSFVAAHYDYVNVNNLVSPLDGVLNTRADVTNLDRLRNRVLTPPTRPDELEDTPVFGEGKVRRAQVAYERTIGRGVGMRLHYEYADSENTSSAFAGKQVPWIPRQHADVGATWAPGWHTFVTVAGAWRSQRYSDEANNVVVPAGWDARFNVYIESADKRWSVELYGFNLLKKETSDAFGVAASWRF
ncbi:MAG: FecR domain-containing protein [Betaproteobacteria bacterium]|nr:FecR domain-containing protein [Betaproteobacteria bacterium]